MPRSIILRREGIQATAALEGTEPGATNLWRAHPGHCCNPGAHAVAVEVGLLLEPLVPQVAAALRLRASGHGDRALLGAVPGPGTVPRLWRLWPHTSGVCAWADAALRTRSHPPLPTTGEYAWTCSLPESKGTINIHSGTPLTMLPSNHALRALTPRHPWLMHTKPPANQPKPPGTHSLPRDLPYTRTILQNWEREPLLLIQRLKPSSWTAERKEE